MQSANYKILQDINFPVFGITSNYEKVWEEFNILYIRVDSKDYVLDNKNLVGDTVGKRRLRIGGSKMYIPRSTISNLPQLLKSKYKLFMDNIGIVFKYVKKDIVPLKYYKVKDITRLDSGCVIQLKGIDYLVRINCRKAYGIKYVGLLHTKMGLILYELSETTKSNTWRKI